MDLQVVLSAAASVSTPRNHDAEPVPLWRDVRLAPAYIAGLSVAAVLLQSTFGAIRTILADVRTGSTAAVAPARGIRAHIVAHGGGTIFAFKAVRAASVFALLGLYAADLAHDTSTLAILLFFTYLYTSGLTLLNIAAAAPLARTAAPHLVLILLGSCAVYGFRDVWPLVTYSLHPVDAAEGATLWVKVALLVLAGILVPLAVPRQYVPIDPENPSEHPNPEQTCSILSLLTYSFLDQTIFTVKNAPLQSEEHIPQIADYDRTTHLVTRSAKHLDVFAGARRQHMFFGLMRIFGKEYIVLAAMMALRAVTALFAPIGINRLLAYLESGGQHALVQPWFWCLLMFLGPFVGTLIMQYYLFLTAGMLVRAEGIITQLVFEHALRLRVKSETAAATPAPAAAPTPDTASLAGTDANTAAESEAGESSHAGEASTGTAVSDTGSAKGDAKKDGGKTDGKKDEQKVEKKDGSNFVGKINNLVTTDLQAIVGGRDMMMIFVYSPLTIAISVYFLYLVLGWSAFVGLAVMIACLPVPGYLASLLQSLQRDLMQKTDARVQAVTEMMGVLRMIKMFGWEGKFAELLDAKRSEELRRQKKEQLIALGNDVLTSFIPVLQMVATYGTFTLVMGGRMTPSIVFPSMSVFMIVHGEIGMFFYYGTPLIKAKVSLDRVTEFLRETELLDHYAATQRDGTHALAPTLASDPADSSTLGIRNASFTWSAATADGTATTSHRPFMLRIDDELTFKNGAVNLIVGSTGSGKTSLIMALLGEMHCVPLTSDARVSLPRAGGVAYAAQESWVQNETIRDNILFGAPYDETRYKKVIYQCGLKRDLSLFDAGDKTEVGEKGLTLSGGQKARVTLARAIYSSADIILLDDVLAALDVHTAKWIIDKCLKGDLVRGRTVVLVTHNVALAGPIADFVVSLGMNGTIAARGSYQEVLSKDQTIAQEAAKEEEILTKTEEEIEEPDALDQPVTKSDGKLVVKEEVAEGHVSLRALKLFWSALGGNHPVLFWTAYLGGTILYHAFVNSQSFFLGRWAEAYTRPGEVNVPYYLTGLALLVLVSGGFYVLFMATFVFGQLRAAKKLHALLMDSILGTTLRWLDTTPTSRVITRCTKDIASVDGRFSGMFDWLVRLSVELAVKLLAIAFITPAVLIPGILLFAAGTWLGSVYMKAQLPVKRIMSTKKAPVLGHFGAAIAASIRAYGAEGAFRAESYKRIEDYTRSGRILYNLNRWVSTRSDFLGGIFSAGLAVYMVYGPAASVIGASNVGFALSMAAAFSSMVLWWVRAYNDFEVEGNSLERIQQYMEIEQEPKPTKENLPPAAWPVSGSLRVEGLSARYSPDGPKVLHNLSFTVNAGERVGIVGRTGSGKSTLTLSLLRCIYTDGAVYYDGVDTASLNLDVLRTNVTIIPQVPELLSGTLRENLDPFGEHDDAVLNSALRASGLFSLQSATDEGRITLDSQIAGGGGNLSVGQRQILALARALVRGSKLLILDEATSSIDYETDSIIQSSLRNELGGDVTLLTVAHRLQTIMDADKIMVLDAGRIVEYDSPKTLLEKEGGFLKSLVDESGDKDALYAMAGGAPL